ncbi:major type 1 subunit fimbrin (pilin) [Variovorax boronicumulans]|uniref:fimbrial protein n=1 Tax=Variovorax boronicumulans TaxID=436515 RepID=UPI0027844342|nr:fimbrial protein [Variovorax boronicumulans]MDP9913548.1 major type 1 subunit fimbrin (pilin) [Variovorax boronicumulans]
MSSNHWPWNRLGRPACRLLAALTLLLSLWWPAAADAQPKCELTSNSAKTMYQPSYVLAPRDLPIGGALSAWSAPPTGDHVYRCTGTGTFGLALKVAGLSAAGMQTAGTGGGMVTVFGTGLPGVGVAFEGRIEAGSCRLASVDLGGPGASSGAAVSKWSPAYGQWLECTSVVQATEANPVLLRASAWMRYIKTGPTSAGLATFGQPLIELRHSINGTMTRANWGFNAWPLNLEGHPTCTAQDLTVDMGKHKSSAFTGIGTASALVKTFAISVTCPPEMRGTIAGVGGTSVNIGYLFSAPAGLSVPAQGVVALSSGSTATGVGLQLRDGAAVPLQFGKRYTLQGYNYKTGSTLAIQLQAAYYQTGATVSPGTADAVVTFTLDYQ